MTQSRFVRYRLSRWIAYRLKLEDLHLELPSNKSEESQWETYLLPPLLPLVSHQLPVLPLLNNMLDQPQQTRRFKPAFLSPLLPLNNNNSPSHLLPLLSSLRLSPNLDQSWTN